MTLCRRYANSLRSTERRPSPRTEQTAPNKALQTDKVKLSRLLRSQEPRQFAFAAELGCYTSAACRGGRC